MRKKINGFDCVWFNKSGTFFYNVPTKKKRPSGGGFIRRFIKLKAEDLLGAIKEIENRKLHKKFHHLSEDEQKKKLKQLKKSAKTYKFNRECADKLSEVVGFFSWKGFQGFRLRINYSVSNLEFNNGVFTFNPKWVQKSSERDITLKIRQFVMEKTRQQ